MKFTQVVLPLVLSGLAVATPTQVLDKRATTICGQWDSVATGSYIVYQDLWGESAATSGSQCTTVTGVSGTTLSWSTKWTWAGGSSSVKSFANAVVVQSSIKKLSAISTIPTVWKWTYSGSSVVADVAYDMFTSSTSGGSAQYEIMIWLDAIGGAGPISSTGSSIATVTLASVTFKLYKGVNGAMTVFSFVASPSGSTAKSFSGDLKTFFTYLINNQGLPSSQYLNSIGAGTEPFTGSAAVFTSTAYSCVVN